MAELFYPNYYTVGSLITTLFAGFIAFFLFQIPNRGRATFHLLATMVAMAVFNLAYVLNNGFYGIPSFFWRWLAVCTALIGAYQIIGFTAYFYRQVSDRYMRYFWIGAYLIFTVMCGYMLLRFLQEPLRYSFSAHNWESAATNLFRMAAVVIVVVFLADLFFAGTRAFRSMGTERKAFIAITIAYFVISIIPGILNVLSRSGAVSRNAYQTSTVLMNLAGFFLLIVSFINYTQDRTPFLAKVVMISLVTLLCVLQINGYFWFKAVDDAYDREHKEISEKLEFNPNKQSIRPDDYRYRLTKDLSTGEISGNGLWPKLQKESLIRPAMENTYLWHRISTERRDPRHIAEEASPTFNGYRFTIRDLRTSGWSAGEILEKLQGLSGRIAFARSSVSAVETDNLKPALLKLASKIEGHLPGFAEALKKLLKKTEPDGGQLKIQALGLFAPMQAPGTRHYRGREYIDRSDNVPEHYVSYILVTENTINEIGYDYRAYRQTIAETGWIQIILILGVFVFVLIAFRIFFSRTMAEPLNAVITGIKDVESGNLERRVPVVMEDEIGFLAGAFNRMVASIQDARRRLEEYADSLEDKVKERTRELKESLDEIQILKNQQDGDYFLTTLLLKPLGVNQAHSHHHRVEFLIRQKKKFDFRHWSRDIGGDINISHSIKLQGRRYIVFMNADAMGKSIQGAGGALVLGSVLLSIIERTATLDSVSGLYPERWLKNAFIELHKVFESFDGSMLVSTLFGLIDDTCGLVYFINAEHPYPVLWRDKTASFIDSGENMLRKLGTAGSAETIRILTFQLETGDCLIAGSDGKDDILLGTDAKGGRIINEDEEKFLEFVADTGANLQAIEKKLRSFGELIDDLSLLKIERISGRPSIRIKRADKERFDKLQIAYKDALARKDYSKSASFLEQALDIAPDNPPLLKAIAKSYYRNNNYTAAASAAVQYNDLRPDDDEFLLFTAWCFRKNKQWAKAIDIAERLRLRVPDHVGVLEFLVEVSLKLNQQGRAYKLCRALLKAAPDNEKALRWETEIVEPPKDERSTGDSKKKSNLW